MRRLIDADFILNKMRATDAQPITYSEHYAWDFATALLNNAPTVEAIPKDNVYKAIQEMMKYEHEGFINISLARLDEILKKCGVSEDEK